MFSNYKLNILKAKVQSALSKKQNAWQKYKDAGNLASIAYEEMEAAWRECFSAKEKVTCEYEALKMMSTLYREIWAEFNRIRDTNESRIEMLRYESDMENHEMQVYLNQANDEFTYGDKTKAPEFAEQGRTHKERRDKINEEIKSLKREIRDAKDNAKWFAPAINSSKFREAKEALAKAETRHEAAKAKYSCIKSECDYYKTEYDVAHKLYTQLEEELRDKLKEVSD